MSASRKPRDYPPEMLLQGDVKVDLESFFATNPEVVRRGIGLEPDAFDDFRFSKEQ